MVGEHIIVLQKKQKSELQRERAIIKHEALAGHLSIIKNYKQSLLLTGRKEQPEALITIHTFPKYVLLSKLLILSDTNQNKIGDSVIRSLKSCNIPILFKYHSSGGLSNTNLNEAFYVKHGFTRLGVQDKTEGAMDNGGTMFKFYPKDRIILKIKKGQHVDYLCVGDVIYGIKKGAKGILSKLYKKNILNVSKLQAAEMLVSLKKYGLIKPLAEFPFYDLVVFNGQYKK